MVNHALRGLGAFGTTLPEAKKTEFFQFFNLVEVGRPADDAVLFKPRADQFRKWVTLGVTLQSGSIKAMRLVLAREFIESGVIGRFARDIAKSFLAAATGEGDTEVKKLIAHIWHPSEKSSQHLGYLTFLGMSTEYHHELSSTHLFIRNELVAGMPSLTILAERADPTTN